MSPGFKLKYDQMQEGNPTSKPAEGDGMTKAYDAYYTGESNARNLCFVWLDGNRIFLNYSYLISGEYMPALNTILLAFTSHAIVLKGVNLEALYYDIMQHNQRQIVCNDSRYNLVGEGELPLVNEITMTKNEG